MPPGTPSSGIRAGPGCTITGCTTYLNTFSGIITGIGCTISGCTAYGNAANGINTNNGCTIIGCAAYLNTSNGIITGVGCTITGCTARANTQDGIVVSSGCLVMGNTCTINGSGAGDGAGIHVTGGDNRIEGNNNIGADRGIDVDLAGNLIIRNSASGNTTNYNIAAGNRYGPIIDITAGGTPGVAGNSAASTMSTTDPWANLAC